MRSKVLDIDEYLKALDPFCSKFVNAPPSRSLDLNGIVQPLKPRTKGQLGLVLRVCAAKRARIIVISPPTVEHAEKWTFRFNNNPNS